MDNGQVFAPTQLVGRLAEQDDLVSVALEGGPRDVLDRVDDADHPDDWRGVHGAARMLVVERDVAACDRRAERFACFPDPAYRFPQLVIHLGLSRIAEVEIVRDRERAPTGAGHVASRLRNRDAGAHARIEIAIAAVAVAFNRETLAGAADPQPSR